MAAVDAQNGPDPALKGNEARTRVYAGMRSLQRGDVEPKPGGCHPTLSGRIDRGDASPEVCNRMIQIKDRGVCDAIDYPERGRGARIRGCGRADAHDCGERGSACTERGRKNDYSEEAVHSSVQCKNGAASWVRFDCLQSQRVTARRHHRYRLLWGG